MMSDTHLEVPIKVNAWVDERLAPVVEALNASPMVETFSSCQGDGHVYFHVRGEPWELFCFVAGLARTLEEEVSDNCCGFKLRLEWLGSNPVHGALYVTDEALDDVVRGLLKIAIHVARDDFKELVSKTVEDSREILDALEAGGTKINPQSD
jgi:hypothetical protein